MNACYREVLRLDDLLELLRNGERVHWRRRPWDKWQRVEGAIPIPLSDYLREGQWRVERNA